MIVGIIIGEVRREGKVMVQINEVISIPEDELEWSFARSGGPGGQNVNKVSSKAVLRWRLGGNSTLPAEVKARLEGQQRRRITVEGDLLITSQRYRDQERNKQDCLERLREMVVAALAVPRPRKATKPTRGSRRRRLADKRHRSATKEQRRGPAEE
jgi:ribosome-associated protein